MEQTIDKKNMTDKRFATLSSDDIRVKGYYLIPNNTKRMDKFGKRIFGDFLFEKFGCRINL